MWKNNLGSRNAQSAEILTNQDDGNIYASP